MQGRARIKGFEYGDEDERHPIGRKIADSNTAKLE